MLEGIRPLHEHLIILIEKWHQLICALNLKTAVD